MMHRFVLALVCICCLTLGMAQSSQSLSLAASLQVSGTEGSNGASVAYNKLSKRYYTAMAGNTAYSLDVFTETGGRISPTGSKTLVDVRGLWFNSKRAKVQGNAFGSGGWFEYVLDGNGIPAEFKTFISGESQPNSQCVGAFNSDANEVLFFDGTAVYFYDATKGEAKEQLSMGDIIKKNGLSASAASNYSSATIIYVGNSNADFGLLNTSNNTIELFSRAGTRTTIYKVPASQPVFTMFNFAYANGLFWFFDKESRVWNGYKPGGGTASTLTPTPTPAPSTNSGGKAKPLSEASATKIDDSGELYSTFNFNSDNADLLARWNSVYGKDNTEMMISRSVEGGWPEAIKTLTGRNENRAYLNKYNAYRVADLKDNKTLLWIPASKNTDMPVNMRANFDFYLVIGNKGLTLGDLVIPEFGGNAKTSKPVAPTKPLEPAKPTGTGTGQGTKPLTGTLGGGGNTPKPAPKQTTNANPVGFAKQLDALVEDFANDFAAFKGGEKKVDNEYDYSDYWFSKLKLEGSKDSYFELALLADNDMFVADYGNFTTQAAAAAKMTTLKKQIDAISFSVGAMTYAKDEGEGGMVTMGWFAGKPNHDADKYSKMLLIVRMQNMAGKGNPENWKVYLNIFTVEEE